MLRLALRYYNCFVPMLEKHAGGGTPLLARLVFAALMTRLFWNSALTKFSEGGWLPGDGALIQMFPHAYEMAGYDSSQMAFLYHVIAFVGTYGELILPLMVLFGVFTRLSALGMIGFVVVMTFVDVTGHGAALGSLFNNAPNELIDQRLLWIFLLSSLVVLGGGWLSVDQWLKRWALHIKQ